MEKRPLGLFLVNEILYGNMCGKELIMPRKTTALCSWLSLVLLMMTIPAVVQAQFVYTTNNGAITITGYTGTPTTLTIPSTTNGYPVTSIGSYAFYQCSSLTSVMIGTNVTSIGYAAFQSCPKLTNITIPNSVTSIGDYTFRYCTSLTSITIPNSVTSIGDYTFRYCTSLTSITIPDSVTSIGSYAFSDCTSLTNVTIPNSVTNIGSLAFNNCTSLTSIAIPNSITNIGNYAFRSCTSLTAISVDTNNPVYSSLDGVLFNKSQTTIIQYPPLKAGTSYTIPNSVTNTGSYAFYKCTSLTTITIANSVTSIETYAFSYCTWLTSITMGTNVTSIGDYTFRYCTSLTSITIPNSVTSIGTYAFSDCTSLTNVTIGNSVISIGISAFSQCTSLTNITIPNSVTSIGDYGFSQCTSLTNVMIGNSVISMGNWTFHYCTSLTSITIPNSVTGIGGYAFSDCTSLTSITIPNSVTSIGTYAFLDCTSLTNITIGNGVKSIGTYAFYNCTSLTSITIPNSVISIADYAFSDCTSLTSVYFEGSTPGLGVYVFRSDNNATVYYFPGTTGWASTFGGRPTVCLLLPLVITVQPQSRTNNVGATVTFHVSATSPTPMGYQWQKNGTSLADGGKVSGANTNTLSIMSISDSDAAMYAVVLTNSYGSVTSSDATLTVIDPPLITAQPSHLLVLQGTNVSFGVSVTGSAAFLSYQWRFNGTNLVNATSAVYTIPSVATNNAGNYSVVITNAAGSAVSSNASLTVVMSPKSQTNYAGSTAMFTATAFSPETLNYQWQKNGTNLVNGANISGATNSTLTITGISDSDAGTYRDVVTNPYGSVTSSNAILTVNNLPFLTSQPQPQVTLIGSNVTFTAAAYGAPPLVFQWYFNGSPAGPPTINTNCSTHTLADVGANQSGNYMVKVVNGYGTATSSNATLTVVSLPPTITVQPTNQAVKAGTTATVSIIASSMSPMSYQWQKNDLNLTDGGRISGATTNTLIITAISSSDAGIYSVRVKNLAGGVTSSNATLTLITPPSITMQPLGQRVLLGGSVSFNVSLDGTAPFSYRWRFNGANILYGTNAVYTIQAVTTTNTGQYSVVVTNLLGSDSSSDAVLTVMVPPTLELELWAGYPLLSLGGMLSNNFVVEYSTNLAGTNWMNLLSLTNLPFSPYQFLDTSGDEEPSRFYRALMQ